MKPDRFAKTGSGQTWEKLRERSFFLQVAATTLFSGLTGGLTSTCGRAITADCVPVDPVTLVPIAPARDFMVASYASIIPSLIIPVRAVQYTCG